MPLDRKTTAVVFLGASQFPDSEHFSSSEAFANSKNTVKKFFLNGIPGAGEEAKYVDEGNCLDLFDSDLDPNRIDKELSGFIKKRPNITDLIIYYIGHGGYDNGFVLTIKSSRDDNLAVSSIRAQTLGQTLSKVAGKLRLFLFLDCCFAGEMARMFQAPVQDFIVKDISEAFPPNGLALLCSSSKDRPSQIVEERNITMFSEAFESALKNGIPDRPERYLTLRELGNITFNEIKIKNPGKTVRPEVHTPRMPNGDIADLRHFYNYSFHDLPQKALDISARMSPILKQISDNNLLAVSQMFSDFVNDFDKNNNYLDTCILCGEMKELEEMKPGKEKKKKYSEYVEKRKQFFNKVIEIMKELKVSNS